MAAAQWTSKLGNKYSKDEILANDAATQKELKLLRGLKAEGNTLCADCGEPDNSWASVTHGVFLCIVCSDVHRAVGTHITKMKGCTGTYLWGPDELEMMRSVGNRRADGLYGSSKISRDASKVEKQRFVERKYSARQAKAVTQLPQANVTPVSRQNKAQVEATEVHATLVSNVPAKVARCCVLSRMPIPDSVFDDLFGDMDLPPAASQMHVAPSMHSTDSPLLDLLA